MLCRRAADVRGGVGKHQIVGMCPDSFAHTVDEIECALHCWRSRYLARHPDGKEQRVQPALSHSGNVDVDVLVPHPDVKSLIKLQSLWSVIVRIDVVIEGIETFTLFGP